MRIENRLPVPARALAGRLLLQNGGWGHEVKDVLLIYTETSENRTISGTCIAAATDGGRSIKRLKYIKSNFCHIRRRQFCIKLFRVQSLKRIKMQKQVPKTKFVKNKLLHLLITIRTQAF